MVRKWWKEMEHHVTRHNRIVSNNKTTTDGQRRLYECAVDAILYQGLHL